MDYIKRQLGAEIIPVRAGIGGSGIGGNANLAGRAKERVSFERDYIGGRRIVHELSMKPGEFVIREENNRELAVGNPG